MNEDSPHVGSRVETELETVAPGGLPIVVTNGFAGGRMPGIPDEEMMSVIASIKSLRRFSWFRRQHRGDREAPMETTQPTSHEGVVLITPGRWPKQATLNLKRILVLFGAVAAPYFAVGSSLFPGWYFGIFWGGKFWNRAWWMDGVSYWLDLHTGMLALAIVSGFVIALLAYAYRRLFLPFVDRFAFRLVFGFGVAILATALLDYKYAKPSFKAWELLEAAMGNLKSAVQELINVESVERSDLEVPIDFQYVDRVRVEALYSQLEPELVEKQRTVSAGESMSGKGSVAIGPAGGEVGAARQKGAMSSFERASFSPERKCVEVMKFVLGQRTAHFYTNGSGWFGRRIVRAFREELTKALKESESSKAKEVTEADLDKLRLRSPDQPPTKEEEEEAKRREKQYTEEFGTELNSLNGLVLIDGTFAVHRNSQGGLVLVERFSEKPRHIVFRVLAPETEELRMLLTKGKSRLRVFGTVTRQLGDDGVIEVRAIALY